MKKIVCFFFVLAFCLSMVGSLCTYAVDLPDWTQSETTGVKVDDGIKFTTTKLDTLTYAVYNVAQETQDVAVEITPTYCENKTDYDAWICVSFMGVPAMFNLTEQATTPGFVALYYNYKGTFRIALDGYMKGIYNGRDSWRLMEKGTPLKVGQKNKIELKWDTKENYYHLYINSVMLDDKAQLLLGKKEIIFPTGKKYILVGSYTQDGKPAEYIINSINGKSLGLKSTAVSSSKASSKASSEVLNSSSVSSSIVELSVPESSEIISSQTSSVASDNDGMANDNIKENNTLFIVLAIVGGLVVIGGIIFVIIKLKAKKG